MMDGEHVRLRRLERPDLPILHRWMNDQDVVAWARFSPDHMISLPALEREYEKELLGEDRDRTTLILEDRTSGRPIGWCNAQTWDRKHVSTSLGIAIGEKELWGKGVGTEALSILLGLVFGQQGWHRAELYTLAENERMIRSAEKVGFRRCGLEHEAAYYDGGYHDIVEMELLKSEWQADRTRRAPRKAR